MKKNQSLLNILMVLISLIPLIYIGITWSTIPEIIPVHYNSSFEPDKYDTKSHLLWPSFFIAGISILLYFLMRNISLLDPKRRFKPQSAIFNKIASGVLLFLTAINFIIVISACRGKDLIGNLLFPLIGLLMAFIGNYMNNIKPNYFAGFRLPWTLSDDGNWRKTHHLASKLWFAGGLILTVISLLLPFKVMLPIFIATVLIISIIPAIYSFRLFKNNKVSRE
jgi:uncharacterized membrane protein